MPLPNSIFKTNLIYHVYPSKKNDVWIQNIEQLARRWQNFNHQRVVAIATGPDCCHPDEVKEMLYFPNRPAQFIEMENDPILRETKSFLPLLQSIQSQDPNEATFYAHTKGTSTAEFAVGVARWRNAMYHHLLDQGNVVRELLRTHPCVGCCKMIWEHKDPEIDVPYPTKLEYGNWMFAGTFFWFRNQSVFSHPNWSCIPQDRYGTEAWLSGMFTAEQAVSLHQPWRAEMYPTPSPYSASLYHRKYSNREWLWQNSEGV
jgi:hypothetical protein